MAIEFNKVIIIGNLVRDPQLKFLPNGTPKCELRIASTRNYTTNGERREDTCFVDIVAWSRTGENCNKFLKKGSKILAEGRLDYQEWEAQDGSKRSKHLISADRIQFLDSRAQGGGEDGGNAGAEGGEQGRGYQRPSYAPRATYNNQQPEMASAPAPAPEPGQSKPEGISGAMGIADDDIPF
ncbi:MAG TPA: single-stranded DNA-binding protein [Planctomycetota bacterium]|nr:single-stranded DNA-binding protein [Planctomycetota bacterium]